VYGGLDTPLTTGGEQSSASEGDPGYSKPTNHLNALALETVHGGQIVQAPSPCGENCTFAHSFVGPAYQCIEKDPYDPDSSWCRPDVLFPGYTCSDTWVASTDLSIITYYEATNSSTDFCKSFSSNLPPVVMIKC
jgi:hypothetical protein